MVLFRALLIGSLLLLPYFFMGGPRKLVQLYYLTVGTPASAPGRVDFVRPMRGKTGPYVAYYFSYKAEGKVYPENSATSRNHIYKERQRVEVRYAPVWPAVGWLDGTGNPFKLFLFQLGFAGVPLGLVLGGLLKRDDLDPSAS